MAGIGRCIHCIHSYEEYGLTECRKDSIWDKFDEDEDIDDYAKKYCKDFEQYPVDADDIPEDMEVDDEN